MGGLGWPQNRSELGAEKLTFLSCQSPGFNQIPGIVDAGAI